MVFIATDAAASPSSTFCKDASNAAKSNASSAEIEGPGTLKLAYEQFKPEESKVIAGAPTKLKADFKTFFNLYNKFYSELTAVKYIYLELPASYLKSLRSSLQSAQFNAAEKAIDNYLLADCRTAYIASLGGGA